VAYTAPFDRDGAPQAAIGLVDLGGRRTVAFADPTLTAALVGRDGVGTKVVLGPSDTGNVMREA
jgi:hypothetical protein